jgi:hypothetical protein
MVNPCHLGGMKKCAARRNASKIVFCFEGHAEKMREKGCILAFWISTLPNRAVGLCFVMVCSFFKLVEKGGPDSSARLYARSTSEGRNKDGGNFVVKGTQEKVPLCRLIHEPG